MQLLLGYWHWIISLIGGVASFLVIQGYSFNGGFGGSGGGAGVVGSRFEDAYLVCIFGAEERLEISRVFRGIFIDTNVNE